MLTAVRKTKPEAVAGSGATPAQYDFDFNPIIVVLTNERGPPDNRAYQPAEIQASITKDDIRFNTITQDWNEYVVDDGTRVKIQPIIMKVAKTSKFNNKGAPVYHTDINMTVQVKPPTGAAPAPAA